MRYGPDWPLMPSVYQSWMSSKPNLRSWLPAFEGTKYVNCAFACGLRRSAVNAFQPAPLTPPVACSCKGGCVAGLTAGTIGHSSWYLPTFTLRNALSLINDCHSALPIHDTLSCASTDSGGLRDERLRYGFCFRPR